MTTLTTPISDQFRRAIAGIPTENPLPAAQDRMRAIQQNAEQQMGESEAGRKLEKLRSRLAATSARVDQIHSQHEAAQKSHFDSLAGDSDSAVAESRARAMELHSQLTVLRDERDQLQGLVGDCERELKANQTATLNAARLDAIDRANSDRENALQVLHDLLTSDEAQTALATVAETGLFIAASHGDTATRYVRNRDSFLSSGAFIP